MWHHRLFCFFFWETRRIPSLITSLTLHGFLYDSAFAKSLSNFINDCQSFLSLSFGKRDVLDVYGALFSRSSFPTIHHRSTWNNWGSRCLDTSRVPSLIFYPFLILFFSFFLFARSNSMCAGNVRVSLSYQFLTSQRIAPVGKRV